ncbi:Spiroplasmavirus-related protein [Spiroplasma kunkelii CR2-3x]|uniref:Spiroplasmavirus-related protein n=1 Tax=Spiroplasma kunkelii CR2-3x TaxID=273035 RepID=A0A0K2JI15_SPIKU|nr:hypothetical protein [Spiroplasma kunkelii]ALA98078.1 Spiroplasmavirus-related protein [Spiroplasma kunkelii CR2-3x]
MNALNYVKKEYYLKKVFYGSYVKNIVLQLKLINNNPRNKTGIKNTGKMIKDYEIIVFAPKEIVFVKHIIIFQIQKI